MIAEQRAIPSATGLDVHQEYSRNESKMGAIWPATTLIPLLFRNLFRNLSRNLFSGLRSQLSLHLGNQRQRRDSPVFTGVKKDEDSGS